MPSCSTNIVTYLNHSFPLLELWFNTNQELKPDQTRHALIMHLVRAKTAMHYKLFKPTHIFSQTQLLISFQSLKCKLPSSIKKKKVLQLLGPWKKRPGFFPSTSAQECSHGSSSCHCFSWSTEKADGKTCSGWVSFLPGRELCFCVFLPVSFKNRKNSYEIWILVK